MRIIIDFDYTLYNVEALRCEMIRVALEHANVTAELFRSAEQQVKQELGFYEPTRHAALLVQDMGVRQRMVDAWMAVVDDGRTFLYPDVMDFLERYHEEDTVLLSFGHEGWQRRKIDGAGIVDLVDHVVITSQPKATIFPTLIVPDALVMVNDRGSELDALKQVHPSAVAVWVRRPGDPYADEPCHSADREITDLNIDLSLVQHNS